MKDWLLATFDKDLMPIFQLLASSTLAIAAITLTCATLYISYRNNFGWRPVVLVMSHGLSLGEKPYIEVVFEVWNRRKYPILLRAVEVTTDDGLFDPDNKAFDFVNNWMVHPTRCLVGQIPGVLEGNSYKSVTARGPIKKEQFTHLRGPRIKVFFFDPKKNKLSEITEARKSVVGRSYRACRRWFFETFISRRAFWRDWVPWQN